MTTTTLNRLDNNLGRFQCLSGNQIKMIAVVCMFIDHFWAVFYTTFSRLVNNPMLQAGLMTPEQMEILLGIYNFFRSIGRIAFPLFCFAFAEGYAHTHSKGRYLLRLALFALISEVPFDITFQFGGGPEGWSEEIARYWPMHWRYQNVFFTFLMAFSGLWLMEKTSALIKWKPLAFLLQCGVAFVACYLAEFKVRGDYDGFGVFFIFVAYFLRKNRIVQIAGLILATVLFNPGCEPIPFAIALVLMLLYNGQRGQRNLKYFFYWFYPVHIALLGLTNWYLFTFLWNRA